MEIVRSENIIALMEMAHIIRRCLTLQALALFIGTSIAHTDEPSLWIKEVGSIKTKAAAGDARAMGILSNWKRSGTLPPIDIKQAEDLAQKSYDLGDSFGKYSLAIIKKKRKEDNYIPLLQDSVESLKKLANEGDYIAQYYLGANYLRGDALKVDYMAALDLFKKSASQGCALGQYGLGICYFNGLGVEKNLSEAVRLHKLAADQGLAWSQKYLGVCYENGTGVEKNPAEAVRLYKLAADQGNDEGQKCLATCYFNGLGVEKNPAEAVRLYKLAADQGNDEGQACLATCYFNGLGVEKNLSEAVRLYKLAADQGNIIAKNELNKDYIVEFVNKQKTDSFIKEIATKVQDPESGKNGGPDTITAIRLGLSNESSNSSEKQVSLSMGMLMMKMSDLEIKSIKRGNTLESLGYSQIPKGTAMYPIRFVMATPNGMEQNVDIYCFKDEFGDWSSISKKN